MIDIKAAFETYGDEFLKFDDIVDKLHPSRDVCALLLVHHALPFGRVAIASADHDIIYLSANCVALSYVLTEQHVVDLVRCGVSYDSDTDSLTMFV